MVLWMVCIKIYSVQSSKTLDCESINMQFIVGYDVPDWETLLKVYICMWDVYLVWDIYKTKCLFVLYTVLSVTKSYLHIFVISSLIKITIGRCNIFSKYISFLWFKQKASWIFTLSYLWNNWNKSVWNDWSIHTQNTFGIALNDLEGLVL